MHVVEQEIKPSAAEVLHVHTWELAENSRSSMLRHPPVIG